MRIESVVRTLGQVLRRAARAAGPGGTVALCLCACVPGRRYDPVTDVPGGVPGRAPQAMQRYGCGACHAIPGVREARGKVGPPLGGIAERAIIAGRLPNTPDNLIHWIVDPQSISPGTAMPNMGVSEGDARDIAAYLYTLR